MRQIGPPLPASQASTLADVLLAEGIKTHLGGTPNGMEVWVIDEDRLNRARELLATFLADPEASRHAEARNKAKQVRTEENKTEREYERLQHRIEKRMTRTARDQVTLFLVVVSVAVSLFSISLVNRQDSNLDEGAPEQVVRWLSFANPTVHIGKPQAQIPWMEPWRMVTPIFLHFGVMHLVFNMLMLISMGSRVERAIGPYRYAALVLALAIFSNLAQGLMVPHHNFGGMSGVVYGIFGFIWVQMSRAPSRGLAVDGLTSFIMMAWFFAGFSSQFNMGGAAVANHAHAGGLLMGLLIGAVWTD
ncbi:MAG: rhomboid family intramembrane serine protease [Gemmataceae bacterium]|jgi:GlpG protein|nr:rhomboid family intramembrane serine protease [Planctomycetota bacterium]